MSKHEIQRMIEACAPPDAPDGLTAGLGVNLGFSAAFGTARRNGGSVFPFPEDWNPPSVSPGLSRFKHSWEAFVDTLVREWKTLNLVSVLLCTYVNLHCKPALSNETFPGPFLPCFRYRTQQATR